MSENVIIRDATSFASCSVVSPTTTSIPSYAIAIQPQRSSNPQGVCPSVPVALNFDASAVNTTLTTTNLSANSTYTSSSLDSLNYMGRMFFIFADQPLECRIEESIDGSTFRASYTFYVSANILKIVSVIKSHRYQRIVVRNIGTASTSVIAVYTTALALIPEQKGIPLENIVARTTTSLSANGSYTSPTIKCDLVDEIRVMVFADQSGTLYIDESFDGSTFRNGAYSLNVSANTTYSVSYKPSNLYVRVRYVNGATAQSTFELSVKVIEVWN